MEKKKRKKKLCLLMFLSFVTPETMKQQMDCDVFAVQRSGGDHRVPGASGFGGSGSHVVVLASLLHCGE